MSSCPRCPTAMQSRVISDFSIEECPTCEGVFLDGNALAALVAEPERGDALLAALPRRPHSVLPRDGKLYVKCPTCSTIMNRKQFATAAGIVIDVCRDHGTFFDAGELCAIVDYVRDGGLERSAKKDALRAREGRLRERANALHARLLAARAPSVATRHFRRHALTDFLVTLFD